MRAIVKASLVMFAALALAACTVPTGAPDADAGPSADAYLGAAPVAATFTEVEIDPDLPFEELFGSDLEAAWSSPTTFTVLTHGGGTCYDQPSTIVALDSTTIRVEYESITSEVCTADLRAYLNEIEIPEGITAGTPVELSVVFPARGAVDQQVVTTTIANA